ncbi:hypothetical protein ACVWYS_003846 [Arthrobacter sp. TE12231]
MTPRRRLPVRGTRAPFDIRNAWLLFHVKQRQPIRGRSVHTKAWKPGTRVLQTGRTRAVVPAVRQFDLGNWISGIRLGPGDGAPAGRRVPVSRLHLGILASAGRAPRLRKEDREQASPPRKTKNREHWTSFGASGRLNSPDENVAPIMRGWGCQEEGTADPLGHTPLPAQDSPARAVGFTALQPDLRPDGGRLLNRTHSGAPVCGKRPALPDHDGNPLQRKYSVTTSMDCTSPSERCGSPGPSLGVCHHHCGRELGSVGVGEGMWVRGHKPGPPSCVYGDRQQCGRLRRG